MKETKKVWIAVFVAVVLGAALAIVLKENAPGGGRAARGEAITVYCAAGIKNPVEALAAEYEAEYGVRINLQYGGSGTLYSQLKIADQADLYLAADASYTDLAHKEGIVREILPVAVMRPVIAVPKGNPRGIAGVDDLLRDDLRLALGNPDAAAIGRVSKRLLTESGHWEALVRRVEKSGVFKPTVPELANAVAIGGVDAAIVWDSTARQQARVDFVEAPELAADPTEVTIAVVAGAASPSEALRFARYLNSKAANATFEAHGFTPAPGDAWTRNPELTFFCGAVNRRAVAPVIEAFEKREGVTVNAVYNGCGILTGQMRAIRESGAGGGAGFPDIYMACDRYYLDNVQDWFTEGRDISEAAIVIAVPEGNPAGISGIEDLAKPGMKVTVGQPEQCTIGALTKFVLQDAGLYDEVMANVVMQTASSAMLVPTVATGSADATIAYITDTRAEANRVDVVPIPLESAIAVQPFAVAHTTPYPNLAQRFLDHLLEAEQRFNEAGFTFIADRSTEAPAQP